MMSRLKLPVLLVLIGLTLGGCGIKPHELSPPSGAVKDDKFPHVYPYDPTGKVKNK